MKYNNSFFRMYKILMEESARHKEYIRKMEIERIMRQQHKQIEHINKLLRKNKKE
jgi:hypothetical protein